ncbi:hypothetical protein CEXT_386001 [Caerostris extrusa]|uniref:Uncharacterized protein n=1 Tax=Caerostris extrusa TaxID=172846 RepID=A0AAV4XS30_CAEEX|nr:hypothetical protein CEXT_386001 [Caerostris extrusa]
MNYLQRILNNAKLRQHPPIFNLQPSRQPSPTSSSDQDTCFVFPLVHSRYLLLSLIFLDSAVSSLSERRIRSNSLPNGAF